FDLDARPVSTSPPVNRGRRPPNMLSHRVQVLPPLGILIHAHPLRTCLKPIRCNRLRDNQLMPRVQYIPQRSRHAPHSYPNSFITSRTNTTTANRHLPRPHKRRKQPPINQPPVCCLTRHNPQTTRFGIS